jgi:hypothetical protein
MELDPSPSPVRAQTARPWWCVALILIGTLVTFSPLLKCAFTDWDDPDTIWANPHMRPATPSSIGYYWTHAEEELYIPLTYTVWGGLSRIKQAPVPNGSLGPAAIVFHAANILVHALAALTAFAILRRIIKHDWAACAGALIFALHPLQTETVAWASGMKDLLAGMFVLIAMWQYLKWIEKPTPWRYAIVIVAMVLGMLSKPAAVVTPLLLAAIDLVIAQRSWRSSAKALWPFFALAIPCILWTRAAQPASLGAHVALWQRPLIACDALAFYLRKLLWPAALGMDYGRTPAMVLAKGWRAAACVVPVAFVAAALWHFRHRVRPLAAGAIIILAGVLPVLGLLPFEFQTRSTVADHYVYVSMLGLALAMAWMMARLPHRVGFYATVIILAALAMRTLDQTRYWKDSRVLFAHAIEVNPLSFSANQNLAVIAGYDAELLAAHASLLADHDADAADECRAQANEKLRESERYLAKVLELQPGFASALHTRAALRARFGRHHEAIEDLNILLDQLPHLRHDEQETFAGDFNMLGQEYLRVSEPEKAIKCFDRMLQLRPNDKSAQRGKAKALAMSREMAEID